ncbi:MAG: sulfite exporter TauE/SafE family protein [Syntrophobacteraceae bacterium]|jgi:thiol:disulfide interchange protein DsbD|nr:sulfite exporter TauE/SafE family protein [Syntrophobacteraceae bacterium]
MNGLEAYLAGPPLLALGAAFAGGALASLAPCVYPMVPIISAYVGSRSAGDGARSRSFLLSLGYVVGMAAVYSLLGMIAALTGSFFGKISTNPWALLVVANVLILVALNILEVIHIPLWTSGRPWEPAVGGLLGAFLVGAASGLVASPCTSPVLFGLLTYVATTQSVLYGGILVFTFTMGMGLLLIVFGTFSGIAASLPRPGQWMAGVKKALGLLMLALAQYYLVSAGKVWF